MRLQVVAVGRLKDGPERELAERYRVRAVQSARTLGFSGPDIVELPESRARRGGDRRAEEGSAILARLGAAPRFVLDERAEFLTSETFASRLAAWRDSGRPALAFVIGGPDGLDETVRADAVGSLCFGRATLPHGIVRALVLEQIYRAFTIIAGHPYHRGGDG